MISKLLKKINPDSKLVKFWDNKRLRALALLPFWILFIVLVYINIAIPYQNSNSNIVNNTVNNDPISFQDMQNELLKHNYHFKYSVNYNGNEIIYEGSRLNDQVVGYKNTTESSTKFYISEDQVYEVLLDELSPAGKVDTNVYEGNLDINNIFNKIKGINNTNDNNQIIYEFDDVYVKISVTTSNISQIEIKENNNKYILEFSEVGEITSIDY